MTNSQSRPRKYTTLLALVIAVLVASAGLLAIAYSTAHSSKTIVSTSVSISTSTIVSSTTLFLTITTTVVTSSNQSDLFFVDFVQQSACPGGIYLAPWEVILGNMKEVQPNNATLPLSEFSFEAAHGFYNDSIISFLVPNGTYSYQVLPKAFLGMSGNLTVKGSDLIVDVRAAPVSCTTTTT